MWNYIFSFKKLKILLPNLNLHTLHLNTYTLIKKLTHFTLTHLQTKKGITLIELIMVMVVVGVLAGGISLGIREAIDLYRFLTFRNEIASQGRLALMRMGREIRQIKDNYLIQTAESSRLRFTAIDLDGDGSDDILEFYRDAGNNELRRIFNDSPAEGNILASDVAALTLTYYDKNNEELTDVPLSEDDREEVYRITITLTLTHGSQALTLRSQVYPRNL